MHRFALALTVLATSAALTASAASAGSAEAPELVDAEGDCAFAPGNEYMDVLAAWISDETATDFQVNLAIAKWTDVVGEAAGFTVQFTHQGVEWGVIAFYSQGVGGWYYQTGSFAEGSEDDWSETSGSFTPGTPAVLQMAFPKDIFPHDGMDHELKGFWAGSVDLKPLVPTFFVPAPLPAYPPAIPCDEAESDAVYVFEQGQHSMAGMEPEDDDAADANATAADDASEEAAPTLSEAGPEPGDAEAPAAGVMLALVAAAAAAVVTSRRRA